ncbi:hypothetical protein NFI96_009181 [Prochilodus magdalenae]|nr:hypothetical protein NFI96_009181 [Prochilodus magdalenae]
MDYSLDLYTYRVSCMLDEHAQKWQYKINGWTAKIKEQVCTHCSIRVGGIIAITITTIIIIINTIIIISTLHFPTISTSIPPPPPPAPSSTSEPTFWMVCWVTSPFPLGRVDENCSVDGHQLTIFNS